MSRVRSMSLKAKVMLVALSALAVMFAAVALVFWRTTKSMERSTVQALAYLADELGGTVDGVLLDVQNTSDLFADDTRLYEYIDKDLAGTGEAYKTMLIRLVRNTVFISYNRPEQSEISAIYNASTGELFNFTEDGPMGEEEIERLLALEVTAAEKLSMTCWYPLGDNFLAPPTGGLRQDSVILGSRRIYHWKKNSYPYVQVFAIPEQALYDLYAPLVAQTGGEVYIINAEGALVSSSNEDAVRARAVPEGVLQLAEATPEGGRAVLDGQEYFVFALESELTNRNMAGNAWTTLLLVPQSYATQDVRGLYTVFVATLLLCVLVSAVMLVFLYRQFMNPISNLSAAMKRVDEGDFGAYLDIPPTSSEAARMIRRYNHMLGSINRSVEERLAFEKRTRELDMQVLVSQINPHFLYNTIETIVWKANMAGHPDIGKLASALGRLYRLSISGGSTWVPLRQEVEHVRGYVEIQKARYDGQFCYLPPVLDDVTAGVMLPKILLQPIVENAFHYAVLESERPVTIRMRVRVKGDTVVVSVTDNGCGMDRARLAAVRRQVKTGEREEDGDGPRRGTGIGLHNISARLELYMGASDALQIHSKKGWGTRITVVLPRT